MKTSTISILHFHYNVDEESRKPEEIRKKTTAFAIKPSQLEDEVQLQCVLDTWENVESCHLRIVDAWKELPRAVWEKRATALIVRNVAM